MQVVSFDKRSLIVNGKRELILSGAVHYPRSTPSMWPRILRECKRAGLNTIETYVFWEGHEPQEGQYNFAGRHDLRRFLELCQREGLYVILRIGPYICAETNFGGLPWWLITKPGMVTRTWNPPFLAAMEQWVRRLMVEVGDCQITRGGPIILAQLENEYCNVSARYGEDGQRYLAWCVTMGRAAGIEVPQIMCEGAPPDAISTLNGFAVWSRVASLRTERQAQPMLWTEAWMGWYDTWGEPHHLRKVEDIAYETLRFFGVGGTGVNHYMWHGGTNFDRDAMFLQATSYDSDAALDEFGLPTDKSDRMGVLHHGLQRHADFFLKGRRGKPQILVAGQLAQHADGVVAYPFRLAGRELAVVVNGNDWPKTVTTRGLTLNIPNHAGVMLLGRGRRFEEVYRSWGQPAKPIVRTMVDSGKPLAWQMVEEPLPAARGPKAVPFLPVTPPHNMLLTTRDETDYGWYGAEIQSPRAGIATLSGRVADLVSVWVDGRYAGTAPERLQEDRTQASDFDFTLRIPLRRGKNRLQLLVHALGMIKGDWMINAPQSEEKKGLLSPLKLDGRQLDADWQFTPGLWGERAGLPDPGCATPRIHWRAPAATDNPLRWYQASFRLTARDLVDRRPWALAVGALHKGGLWINGHGLGRYWQLPAIDARRARFTCHPHLINTGHDQPTQPYYHIPSDWLLPGTNLLVVLEERGALPGNAGLVRRQ